MSDERFFALSLRKRVEMSDEAAELLQFAGHENRFVRAAVARNENASELALWCLANDVEAPVVAAVYLHSRATDNMRQEIEWRAKRTPLGSSAYLRSVLAEANDLKPEIAEWLFSLGSWDVYMELVNNSSCPRKIVEAMAREPFSKSDPIRCKAEKLIVVSQL